jgi:flagellin
MTMALFIQTNVASLEAQRNLSGTQKALTQNFQRLSSGYRINTAADDAAGLGISEQMGAQIRSYSVAERNTNNGISMAQTAEGALGQVGSMLQRMRELSVEGSNGDLTTTDRGFLDTEFTQLKQEIDRISTSTTFNGQALLSGAANTITFQVGINNSSSDQIGVVFGGVDLTSLGLNNSSVTGATATNAQASIDAVDAAIAAVSTQRSNYGAAMNRMQITVSNIQSMSTNLSAANSRIKDVDVAEETAKMARNQVLAQAGAAVLAQANQAPQLAMGLLRG